MQFNLTANITNVSGGSRSLTKAELESITNGVTASGSLSLVSGDSISIVCDLYNRYEIDYLECFFSGASSISCYFAESENSWGSCAGSSISGGMRFYPTSSVFPRWFKINQEASASVEICEVDIISKSDKLRFGFYGTDNSYGFDASGRTIQEVTIKNYSGYYQDISVFIGDSSSEAENTLMISTVSGGPFYPKRSCGCIIPDDFAWNNGFYSGLGLYGNSLMLSGTGYGSYYSPVFDISNRDLYRVFVDGSFPSGSKIDLLSATDSEGCFGVRCSNVAPSGSWISGQLAEDYDSIWSVPNGGIPFVQTPNNTITEFRNYDYIQFLLTVTGSITAVPIISRLGVETPITISGVAPWTPSSVFISAASGTSSGASASLFCLYRGS